MEATENMKAEEGKLGKGWQTNMQKAGMNGSSNDAIWIIILGFLFFSIWSNLNLQILEGNLIS